MTDNEQNLRQTAVDRAMRMLDAAGAQYAVQFNGETYGALTVKPEPKRRPVYERGATRAHYLPYIEHLNVGESVTVPAGPFALSPLASNISAYACHAWGIGSAMVSQDRATGCISVLRIL
jgi:hypothetical protein